MMNGIDIAGHQKGINLAIVPCDFVLIKATQGKTFVNPEFSKQIIQALSLGKYVGVYHYANGAGVDVEADHFIDVVRPYLGKVILCVDWENNKKDGKNDNPMFAAGNYKYCEQLLVAIEKKTGIKPFLYMSKSVARQFKWEVGRHFPFWCAQYKKTPPSNYVANPWTDDKGWGAWNGCKIFQYTSKGRLSGYNGDLDLDIAYMDGAEWLSYAQGKVIVKEPEDHGSFDLPVIRRGSSGKAVKLWQVILGIDPDGLFGIITQEETRQFQLEHDLKVDGIVGAKSWKAGMESVWQSL